MFVLFFVSDGFAEGMPCAGMAVNFCIFYKYFFDLRYNCLLRKKRYIKVQKQSGLLERQTRIIFSDREGIRAYLSKD